MVIRLFVPPGEGQHRLTPKRPEPLGANATLQYAIISSTALAATYTSFASSYRRRVTPSQPISRTALFVRSSARMGLLAGVVGATVNWYYHSAFAEVVVGHQVPDIKPWKLFQWTKQRTVEDGCLAGAGLGLVASVPTLLMRRPSIPRWTRCLGMMNIGACTGILGAHGYLQYTGERQKAYARLDRRMKRRSLEFWAIFWDKELMARFDPLIQHYVRHNGMWYTSLLPDAVWDDMEDYGTRNTGPKKLDSNEKAADAPEPIQEEPAFYTQPFEYLEDLKQIDIKSTLAQMKVLEAEKAELLEESEYLLFVNARKEYEYCHLRDMDDDERQRRIREIHLIEIAYNRLQSQAHAIDIKLTKWRISLQHKAAWEASDDRKASWMPRSENGDFQSHKPTVSLEEMSRFQTSIAAEVKNFENLSVDDRYPPEKRERWRLDLEDGRVLLRAVDNIVFELERVKRELESANTAGDDSREGEAEHKAPSNTKAVTRSDDQVSEVKKEAQLGIITDEKKHETALVEEGKAEKPPTGSLEADKP